MHATSMAEPKKNARRRAPTNWPRTNIYNTISISYTVIEAPSTVRARRLRERRSRGVVMADRDGAYWDSNHVGHRETVERVSKLLTSAMGEIPAVDEQGQSADWNQQFEQALEPPENAGSYDFS